MRELLRRMFHGRYGSYGSDKLTRFLLLLAIILLLISITVEPLAILYYVGVIVIVYCYFRLLSKNITKRYRENELFENFLNKLSQTFKKK